MVHGRLVRDVPPGRPPRADDELGFGESVTLSGVRCRRSPGEPRAKRAPIPVRRSPSRTSCPPSRRPSGPDRIRTEGRRGTSPGGDRPPRGERGPSSEGNLPADDRAARGVEERDVGHSPGAADFGRLRDSARGDRRTRGTSQKRRRHHGVCCCRYPPVAPVTPDPSHLHEPGQLVPRDLVAARLAAMTFANDMSVWIPLPEKFACSRAQAEDSEEDYACVPEAEPTGTVCSFSPACVAPRRAGRASTVPPLGSVVMAPPSTHKEALQGERRRHRAEPRS